MTVKNSMDTNPSGSNISGSPREDWEISVEVWLNKQIKVYGPEGLAISDLPKTKEKLLLFLKDGLKSLHIVSDFDATLTKYWIAPGVKFIGGHNILGETDVVSLEFVKKLQELEEKYVSYETSLTHSIKEKAAKLEEWHHKVYQTFVDEDLKKEDLKRMATQVKTIYREGARELIELSDSKRIPLMIFSAGISDIIEALLESEELFRPNAIIVSNKMIFSDEPPFKLTGFVKPSIHVYNKGDMEIQQTSHYQACVPRENLILIGDSLGDINMGAKLPHTNILKVGLLNYDIERLLPHYLASFDIVLKGDIGLSFVNDLLDQLK